ncbi:MAG TPA: phosphoenolpyruvate carboxylase [Planctomycetaceae bacterium]|nr:phosphoenolpyruvate carboxylase [Planctomycetaceae bacterium]
MASPRALRQDVETLNGLLEEVLIEQAGGDFATLLRQIRQLAQERRVGLPGAGERLATKVRDLSEAEIAVAVRALSISFDLANLAEDSQRVRVLREREQQSDGASRPESIGDAILRLKTAGVAPDAVQHLLEQLRIDLVFTAHPTEAKRRTTRRVLRELRQSLHTMNQPAVLPREFQDAGDRLLSDLTLLWQVDPIRPQRPTVMNEVERGLFFFDGLWEVVPELRKELRGALREHYPGHLFHIPPFITFGSWIGGDRDGNPFVTTDVTSQALELLRKAAIERHLGVCRRLTQLLVMSSKSVAVEPAMQQALDAAVAKSSAFKASVQNIAPVEVYRRWLKIIEVRLEATLAAASGTATEGIGYRTGKELGDDVRLIADSITRHQGERIVHTFLSTWQDQIETFGLQFASLDVRQDSRVHTEVLAEIFKRTGTCSDYAAADEATRQQLLLAGPTVGNELLQYSLSDMARETLSLLKLMVRIVRSQGPERFGGHVISMTHHPSDVLAVWWLWQWAWKATPGDQTRPVTYLPIIPLFETIDDLQRGPEILEALVALPAYRDYLRTSPEPMPTQCVMVGYSDSTKDGGYLAACWGLFCVQEQLADVTARHGLRLVVFHGRGGALGRGGGPAARAIMSLPSRSVGGSLRMTEQGEVLSERYDDPQIARRHLEQVTWATLLVSGEPQPPVPEEWFALIDRLAQRSFVAYRELVEHPGFLPYFDQATPISEIERLPIGSRPSRRRERKSLSDLRAIPWTFAWTQSRQFIPAWYGLGTALLEDTQARGDDWSLLQTLYARWPLFQAVIDNAVLALAKADLGIAQRYAELAEDHPTASAVWQLIETEFQRSQAAVLMITKQPTLLAGTPWLQHSIQERNPSVDPLNLMQIELIRRMRSALDAGQEDAVLRLGELVRLTIQGVASGLRTTG